MNRDLATPLSPPALAAEEARLARFFKSINKHRAALDLAVEESFDGELDPSDWRRAFDSSEPADTIRTVVITGSYSAIVNACVEILKAAAGSRLTGLLPHRRPHAEQVFDAVQSDGGLTGEQVALLNDSYVLEGRLEHASPDVDAEEVREHVARLREELPGLIESIHAWLKSYGIAFGQGPTLH
ncbi:MAG TPA: hypothetical protein VF085_11060 [Solirubrobacterales bacterium]